MALILFYDATELDKSQLSAALGSGGHDLRFITERIEPANCDPEAEAVSVFVTSSVTREVMEALPKLKLIACRSTGFDNVDMAAAAERGIAVVNVPTYGEATVAEYVFALLLALRRKLPAVLDYEKRQPRSSELTGHDLEGKVFGVIGTGHIGLNVLKIAAGFSMQTIAYDTYPNQQLEDEHHFKYVDLDELLEYADVVSLHVPYLPTTHHLMNRERLGKMKPGAVLINTARGEVVDTRALVELLAGGRLGGAAIDVIEGEKLLNYQEETALLRSDTLPEDVLLNSVEISALEKMPNVIISPHNAFNTVEAVARINQTTAQNLTDFWQGKPTNQIKLAQAKMGKLLIVRHTESEWNATGQWTGITDVHLDEKGFRESAQLGQALKGLGVKVDVAFCSEQIRSRETLEGMLKAAQQADVKIEVSSGINERDYGEYTGKNKWEVEKLIGEDAFDRIRRGWDEPIPGGETLKMVYERAAPLYLNTVLPLLRDGKNVLIVAHGNSLRALVKYLESISDEGISRVEMMFGQIVEYDVSTDGHSTGKQVSQIDTTPPPA